MYTFPTSLFNISDADIPASLALHDETDLQLCGLNTELSTPTFEISSLIHLDIVRLTVTNNEISDISRN